MTDDKKKPDDVKPKQPLSSTLASVGAIVCGLIAAFFVGPHFFPNEPGQGFNLYRVLCAGAGGAIGAGLGWAIGWAIEAARKKD